MKTSRFTTATWALLLVSPISMTTTTAAPTTLDHQSWSSPHFWSLKAVSASAHSSPSINPRSSNNHAICNLSRAKLPQAPTPLPPPTRNLTLAHVSIGRGTQNYTCDLTNATAIPVSTGAKATLFDVSCIAVLYPSLLSLIPAIAVNLPLASAEGIWEGEVLGHHYFLDASTPFFDLGSEGGKGAFSKKSSSGAPRGASKGVGGVGQGAVPWLTLVEKDCPGEEAGQQQRLKEVYRVNTAGGVAPVSCVGQEERIEVEYAAEYWIYV